VARRLVLLACMFPLAGCVIATEPRIQLGGSAFHLSLSNGAVNVLVLLLLAIILVLAVLLIRRRHAAATAQRFAGWLAALPAANDPDLADLQTYSNVHWANTPTDDLAALRAAIETDAQMSAADKIKRAATLGQFHYQWKNRSSAGENGLTQILAAIRQNGSGVFLSIFALAVFITLAVGMASSSFFSSLAQVDQARGLITFLVAISAVAVILLTAVNIFWTDNLDFNVRFVAAKDLVTIVTGILGTILGFYFGSFNGERLLTLAVDSPASYSSITPGADVDVRANGKGGTPPYYFDILVIDANGAPVSRPVENKQSQGAIAEKIKAPDKPTGKHSVVVLLRDAKGLQTRESVDVLVKSPESPPPAPPNNGAQKDAAPQPLPVVPANPNQATKP
jgi:hypothetical protein